MGQIVIRNQVLVYCNLAAIQSGGTKANQVLADGEIWLVDTTNANKTNGTGVYDAYIKGNGSSAAKNLTVQYLTAQVDLSEYSTTSEMTAAIQTAVSGKQNTISDLATIRSGAALGATAIQEHQDISGKANVADVYTKSEVNNLIVPANTTISVVETLPASGVANTIYRVAGTTNYKDYGWDGTQFVELATYDNLIDNTPTKDSNNLVKSSGVYNKIKPIEDIVIGEDDEVISITVPATAGSIISNATQYQCRLQQSRIYNLVYTGTVKNITAYFRSANDASSVGVYVNGASTTSNSISLTPSSNTRTIEPSADVYILKFYATAANVVNTEDVDFTFTWESTSVPITRKIQTLEESVDQTVEAMDKKIDVQLGKNLFNKASITEGKYFNSNGNKLDNASYAFSDFIEVDPSKQYFVSRNGGGDVCGDSAYHCFYDETKTFIDSVVGSTQLITPPSGAKYIRLSIVYYTERIDTIQFEEGTSRTDYEEYSVLGGYISVDETPTLGSKNPITSNAVARMTPIKMGKNLYNYETDTPNKFLNTSGVISSNSQYQISDFIEVEPSTQYCISDSTNSSVGSAAACHVLYSSSKTRLGVIEGTTKVITTTAETAFIRISILSTKTNIQVEKGNERTAYNPYSLIGGYPSIVTDDSVGFSALKQEVVSAINSVTPVVFNSLRGSATLEQNGLMRLAVTHVLKNTLLSAKIKGTIEQVSIGVGYSTNATYEYRTYQAHWLVLTPSQIKLYNSFNNGWNLAETYTHGLTLTNNTTLTVSTTVTTSQVTTLRLFDDLGNVFEQTLPSWGLGSAFATNDGSSSLDIDLSFMPRDITHNVWCFGDSYFNFTTSDKWTYHAMKAGMSNWLADSQPGLAPDSAYTDLQNLLALGYRPSYIVWCLGMNGATTESQSGGDYVINSTQKAVIDNVVTLCENNNIIPVFGTVPTVPDRQKTGFCSYIRTLGKRYIDFAEAVGANSSGVWNTGLLSSDNVHPTTAGAKVLFSQVLIDFPEIDIVE